MWELEHDYLTKVGLSCVVNVGSSEEDLDVQDLITDGQINHNKSNEKTQIRILKLILMIIDEFHQT